jgi:hypothetical protein
VRGGERLEVGREGGSASAGREGVDSVLGDVEPRSEGTGVGEGGGRGDDAGCGMSPSEAGEGEFVRCVEGVEVVRDDEVHSAAECRVGLESSEKGGRGRNGDARGGGNEGVEIVCPSDEDGGDVGGTSEGVLQAEGDLTGESLARSEEEDASGRIG